MAKISPTILLAFIALFAFVIANTLSDELEGTQGTESYFISPHGLGITPEVSWALKSIAGMVKARRTTYNKSSITYILDNITIEYEHNSGKQESSAETDMAKVEGAKIEFSYKFNYTKIENRNNITGSGYGSVLSDNFTYYKDISFCESFLCWRIPSQKPFTPINITNNIMKIQRLNPFNQTDLDNIQEMIFNATTNIQPSNIKNQILEPFNQIFPHALNDSLNHQIFGEIINYTYHSNTHGDMKMNVIHENWGWLIDKEEGFKIFFVTKIDNWRNSSCNITAPKTPASYDLYGGSQTYHLICMYEDVVFYMQQNGWLDTTLNYNWETDAFQFYAGDLFDLISNLHLTFNPIAILDGECISQKDSISLKSSREFDSNTLGLTVNYKCNLKGTNKEGTTVPVMKFTAKTKIYIVPSAGSNSLSFKIVAVEILDLSFEPVGNYFVGNFYLAMYRAQNVFQKLVNTFTFGTGFPSINRHSPKTRVDMNYTFYYDNSHMATNGLFQQAKQ